MRKDAQLLQRQEEEQKMWSFIVPSCLLLACRSRPVSGRPPS